MLRDITFQTKSWSHYKFMNGRRFIIVGLKFTPTPIKNVGTPKSKTMSRLLDVQSLFQIVKENGNPND